MSRVEGSLRTPRLNRSCAAAAAHERMRAQHCCMASGYPMPDATVCACISNLSIFIIDFGCAKQSCCSGAAVVFAQERCAADTAVSAGTNNWSCRPAYACMWRRPGPSLLLSGEDTGCAAEAVPVPLPKRAQRDRPHWAGQSRRPPTRPAGRLLL